MPLYKTITIDATTKVLIWKIEESVEELSQGLNLTTYCQNRLKQIKFSGQKSQFLSIRHLLKEIGYKDSDMYYNPMGKPYLHNGKHISITHSYQFSAIVISSEPVGIDIEKQREKILRVASRFTPLEEYRTLANHEAIIRKLTLVWSAKEAIYKVMETPGLSFLDHIYVHDFDFNANLTTAKVNYKNKLTTFSVKFLEFEGFSCAYALFLPSAH